MKNEQEIFSIISFSGESAGYAFQALDAIENSEYEEAENLIAEGRKSAVDAHKIQTELLFNECNGLDDTNSVSLMMVHAQDNLMNALLLLDLVEKLISVFKAKENR
ncbi:MAG: PTS lactose/cellobiose transporter subunit IIA [Erysipelotrichaceae bacterium]|nr:PTS lactose/cellobiose transporter subunit IIA [Erysipelotrichaceae bacterium]